MSSFISHEQLTDDLSPAIAIKNGIALAAVLWLAAFAIIWLVKAL